MDTPPQPPLDEIFASSSARCQLEAFYTTKLLLNRPLKLNEPKGQMDHFAIGFQIGADEHLSDPCRFRNFMRVHVSNRAESTNEIGFEIEAELWGFFVVPEEIPVEKRKAWVRQEGGAQLYDIFRGIVPTCTGIFPEGNYLLPSLSSIDIINLADKTENASREKKERSKKNKPQTMQAK